MCCLTNKTEDEAALAPDPGQQCWPMIRKGRLKEGRRAEEKETKNK